MLEMANKVGLTEEQEKLIIESVKNTVRINFLKEGIPETEESLKAQENIYNIGIKTLLDGKTMATLNYYLERNNPYYGSEEIEELKKRAAEGKKDPKRRESQLNNFIELLKEKGEI